MKSLLKALLGMAGIRVSRSPAHRFDGMDGVLAELGARGFLPSLVIDGGANRGEWARLALRTFPGVPLLLVEPQAACLPDLEALRRAEGGVRIEAVALSGPGVRSVRMDGTSWSRGSTGTRVKGPGEVEEGDPEVPARSLDELLFEATGEVPGGGGPWLLKLDLEGHEVEALRGASRTLQRAGVVVAETRLLGGDPAGGTDFEGLLEVLGEAGFVLYDVASLSSRPGDGRLRTMDLVFVRRGGPLDSERKWDVEGRGGR